MPGTSIHNHVWKILWRLKLPSNIKIFAWRALQGILPLKCILINRHIGDSVSCHICHIDAKISSIFSLNVSAQDMWTELGLNATISETVDRSGLAVLEHILRSPDDNAMGSSTVKIKELVITTS
jgi:hypothetical protein